jgi:hypothetical protein
MTIGGRDTITLNNGETRRYWTTAMNLCFGRIAGGQALRRSASANSAGGLCRRDGR